MYAEIKNKNSILINRLDDNEAILLKQILEDSTASDREVLMKSLSDESGDFGGILISVEQKEKSLSSFLEQFILLYFIFKLFLIQ